MTEQQAGVVDQPGVDELRIFLAAAAKALRETVIRLEKSVARITELIVLRPDRADRDLVVALQDFDRLQQEFATLADVLVHAGDKSSESWLRTADDAHPAEDVIARISIADLKERLLRHLGGSMSDLMPSTMSEDVVF